MHHLLEHFPDPKPVLEQCWRILKPGGILDITVPHSSNVKAIGCLGHYRTFSYDTLDDYLCRKFYLFENKRLSCQRKKLVWTMAPQRRMRFLSFFIQPLINLSPRVFERLWHAYVGGAEEVQWVGKKLLG